MSATPLKPGPAGFQSKAQNAALIETTIRSVTRALCDSLVAIKKGGFLLKRVPMGEVQQMCEWAIEAGVKDSLNDYSLRFDSEEVRLTIQRSGSEVAARAYFGSRDQNP